MLKRFSDLVGETLTAVDGAEESSERVTLHLLSGESYVLYHDQECRADVRVIDVAGDVASLIGFPIVMADEATNRDSVPEGWEPDESFTWTFYRLATVNGYVSLRWLGTSNGCYAEGVEFAPEVEALT